jgi:hypothetical protein
MRCSNWLVLLPLLTAGCGMDREDFITEYATAYCDWLDGCAKIKTNFGTYDACITQKEIDASEYFAPSGNDCSFEEDKALECIETFEDIACEQAEADIAVCREVSDCYQKTADQEQTAQ